MKNKKDQLGKEYDIAIIGGGVVGGMIAYHLAKYRSRIVILEKESDAAMGQSKANSGIVHAGYDPQPGSLKAILNVKGSEMMEGICRDLAVKYRRNGTFVVGYSEEDNENLKILLERGKQNGVRDLALIDGETVRAAEPHLSQRITCALSAPTGAVVCPYGPWRGFPYKFCGICAALRGRRRRRQSHFDGGSGRDAGGTRRVSHRSCGWQTGMGKNRSQLRRAIF